MLFLFAVDQTAISRSMVTHNYTTSDGEDPIQITIFKEEAKSERLKKLLPNSPYIYEVCCLSYFCLFLSTSHETCLLKSIDNEYQHIFCSTWLTRRRNKSQEQIQSVIRSIFYMQTYIFPRIRAKQAMAAKELGMDGKSIWFHRDMTCIIYAHYFFLQDC